MSKSGEADGKAGYGVYFIAIWTYSERGSEEIFGEMIQQDKATIKLKDTVEEGLKTGANVKC